MNMDKPGVRKKLRRRHHTQRVIDNRAQLAYALGYTPMPVYWQPYIKCWDIEGHRLYRALGCECPCEWDFRSTYGQISKEKNDPTHQLAKHKTCNCVHCKSPRWYYRGSQTKEALGRRQYRALEEHKHQLQEWHEEVTSVSQQTSISPQ